MGGPLKSYVLMPAQKSRLLWKGWKKEPFLNLWIGFSIQWVYSALFHWKWIHIQMEAKPTIVIIIFFWSVFHISCTCSMSLVSCFECRNMTLSSVKWPLRHVWHIFDRPEWTFPAMWRIVLTVRPINNHAGFRHFLMIYLWYIAEIPRWVNQSFIEQMHKEFTDMPNRGASHINIAQFISLLEDIQNNWPQININIRGGKTGWRNLHIIWD